MAVKVFRKKEIKEGYCRVCGDNTIGRGYLDLYNYGPGVGIVCGDCMECNECCREINRKNIRHRGRDGAGSLCNICHKKALKFIAKHPVRAKFKMPEGRGRAGLIIKFSSKTFKLQEYFRFELGTGARCTGNLIANERGRFIEMATFFCRARGRVLVTATGTYEVIVWKNGEFQKFKLDRVFSREVDKFHGDGVDYYYRMFVRGKRLLRSRKPWIVTAAKKRGRFVAVSFNDRMSLAEVKANKEKAANVGNDNSHETPSLRWKLDQLEDKRDVAVTNRLNDKRVSDVNLPEGFFCE